MKITGPHDIEAVCPLENDEIAKDEITEDAEMAEVLFGKEESNGDSDQKRISEAISKQEQSEM